MRFDSVYPKSGNYGNRNDREISSWERDDCGNIIAWYWEDGHLLHTRYMFYTKKEILHSVRAKGIKVTRAMEKKLYTI